MHAHVSADPYQSGLRHAAAGRHADAITSFQAALAQRPDDTRVLFALGNTARTLGMAEGACEFFRRVLALEPDRLEALVNLGNLLRETGQSGSAIALLEPALARAPQSPELWLALGSAYRSLDKRDAAEHHFREALALRGDYPQALGNLADLLADRGHIDEALALYDRAIKRDSANFQARLNRAVLHFLKGDLKAGWRDYAARLKLAAKAPRRDHRIAAWSGGPLKKSRLLVMAEQGIGDQLMFASCIPDLAARANESGAQIILECEPRLVPLFTRSFPDVKVAASDMEARGSTVTARYGWLKALGGANAATEMGTIPRWLRARADSFPAPHGYLVPAPQEKERWQAWMTEQGTGPVIGICWRSGKSGGDRDLQYAPLSAWGECLKELKGEIVSVQYDAMPDEIAQLEQLSGRTIHVPPDIDQKQELDRACALLAALDAVVTAPTAVSWLAAATGTPTYKILYDTSWTAFGQTREPFAPACHCLVPETPGDFPNSFAQARAALENRH
jgi:Flp pilus assembly protein TadD/ADP-heptose:LPS heptosyltransferase